MPSGREGEKMRQRRSKRVNGEKGKRKKTPLQGLLWGSTAPLRRLFSGASGLCRVEPHFRAVVALYGRPLR